jgi:hypothetical protein
MSSGSMVLIERRRSPATTRAWLWCAELIGLTVRAYERVRANPRGEADAATHPRDAPPTTSGHSEMHLRRAVATLTG